MGTLGRLTTWRRVLATAILCAAALPAAAGEDLDRVRDLRATGDILPLEDILSNLPAEEDGRVLEVELEEEGNRLTYEVERLEAGGRVREYRFDARSGELLGVEDD